MANLREQVDMNQATGTIHINRYPGWPGQVIIEREDTTVSSLSPKPDENWTLTDAAGHFHAYDQSAGARGDHYPTLFAKVEHVDCSGAMYHDFPDGDDPCEGYDITRYYCRICDEEIEPGMIPGPHHAVVQGLESWHAKVSVPLEHLQELFDKQVSVRIEHSGGMLFGLAYVGGDVTIYSESTHATVDLVPASRLGRTKAPARV